MRQQLSLLLLKLWTVVICDYKLRYNCDDGNFEYECPLINHWNRNQSYTFKIQNGDWCSSINSALTKIGINLFNHNPKLPICNEEISPKVTFYSTNLNDSTKVVQMCSLDMKESPGEYDNKNCLSAELPRYYALNKEIWVIFIVHGFYDYGKDGKGPKWAKALKNILIKYYSKDNVRRIIVGIVDWKFGSIGGTYSLWNNNFRSGHRSNLMCSNVGYIIDKLPHGRSNYLKAAPTTMLIGYLLRQLHEILMTELPDHINSKTFCIGHSLGAHICGYMGKTSSLGLHMIIGNNFYVSIQK